MATTQKPYYILFVKNAQSLKSTQLVGKQSPRVHLSIGKSVQEKAASSIKENAGNSCSWNETLFVEIRNDLVEFLLVEVKSGNTLIGLGRIAAANISEYPHSLELQLTDQGGKKAGRLSVTYQRFVGDLNQLHAQAHAIKEGRQFQQQASSVTPAANKFLSSINRAPIQPGNVPVGGGFQQPMTQPVQHPGGIQQRPASVDYQRRPLSSDYQQRPVSCGYQQPQPQQDETPRVRSATIVSIDTSGAHQLAPLPPFWEERVDPSTGKLYYINHESRETTWERPVIVNNAPPVSPTYSSNSNDDLSELQALETALQESLLLSTTNQTDQQERPGVTMSAPLNTSDSLRLPPQWEERIDPNTGQPYYLNHSTKETTWDRPAAPITSPETSIPMAEVVALPPPKPLKPSSPRSLPPLPPHWEERVDSESGSVYYVNHETRTTSWERPVP